MYQRSKIWKHCFRTIVALAVSVIGTTLVPTLKADAWDLKTEFTIDQSIEIEGTVLPPGSYVMKLLASSADRHTVQIFNAEQSHLIAVVQAIPAYRLAPTGDSEFKFYEVGEGQPAALRTWFYPGSNSGFEFRFGRKDAAAESARRHANAPTSNAGAN